MTHRSWTRFYAIMAVLSVCAVVFGVATWPMFSQFGNSFIIVFSLMFAWENIKKFRKNIREQDADRVDNQWN